MTHRTAVKQPLDFHPGRYPALVGILDGGDGAISLADRVYDQILLHIVRGELPAGTELRTTALARQLAVSRTPVQAALTRLVADGIVSQTLNQRATVRPGAENWLVDIHAIRQLLEPAAARAAAGRIPAAVLADLARLAHDARPSATVDWKPAALHFDCALHLAIAEHCGNLCLRESIRRCWRYKRLSYVAGTPTAASFREGRRQHAAILEKLAGGNGAAAADLMVAHLREAADLKPGQRIV